MGSGGGPRDPEDPTNPDPEDPTNPDPEDPNDPDPNDPNDAMGDLDLDMSCLSSGF